MGGGRRQRLEARLETLEMGFGNPVKQSHLSVWWGVYEGHGKGGVHQRPFPTSQTWSKASSGSLWRHLIPYYFI